MKNRYAQVSLGAAIAVAAAFGVCAACGGEARQSGAAGSAGSGAGAGAPDASAPDAHAGSGGAAQAGACGTAPVPKEHRAVAQACPTERGSVQQLLPDMTKCTTRAGIVCTKDADCTAGKNGRCFANDACDTVCSYDDCTTDSDCVAGPCLCRTSASDTLNNQCLPGSTCKTDADCNGGCGYCSPSSVASPPSCTVGTVSYNCHSASDACQDESSCGDTGNYCAYDLETGKWGCGLCLPAPHP